MTIATSLLQSSIRERESFAAYSLRATFFTALLGGPIAAVLIHGLNVGPFGRWQRERLVLAAALLASIALLAFVGVLIARPDILPMLPIELRQAKAVSWLGRLLGLVAWAALYWRLREPYGAAWRRGEDCPAWGAGIACAVIGAVVSGATVRIAFILAARP